MSMRSELFVLPNGLAMHVPSAMEARVLYHEIFETQAYCKHGILVRDGDTVFDVGANVGFFSVFLAARHPGIRLFAFEPVPPVFELLERNARAHVPLGSARLLPYGLSARGEMATFRFDPGMTFGASAYPQALEQSARRDASALAWARALVVDAERSGQLSSRGSRLILGGLSVRGVRSLTLAALGAVMAGLDARRRIREQTLTAEVRPLSDVLREEDIERIDLLKVDVEGAEWEVLAGIGDSDWPKIRQLVVEVHDADHRVARVRELLERRGFSVIVDREDWALHELLGIHTVYARRQ
jgi:FkbM family methyltransferase